MPEWNEISVTVAIALGAFVVYLLEQSKRLLTKKVDLLLTGMQAQADANKARDIRGDEIQANVRILTNGSGVHHKDLPKAEPQFTGDPPVIVEHDRRTVDRDPLDLLPPRPADQDTTGTRHIRNRSTEYETFQDRR